MNFGAFQFVNRCDKWAQVGTARTASSIQMPVSLICWVGAVHLVCNCGKLSCLFSITMTTTAPKPSLTVHFTSSSPDRRASFHELRAKH